MFYYHVDIQASKLIKSTEPREKSYKKGKDINKYIMCVQNFPASFK